MNLSSKTRSRKLALPGLVTALLLLGLILPPAARAQSAGPTYVVQPGDTLYSIARIFGVSVDALQKANAIADPTLISVGQKLIIPGYEGIDGALATYQVQLGDSLAGLSKRFGVGLADLIRINHLTSIDGLYVGQPLIYPQGGQGLANGRTLLAGKSDSLLALAARAGLNPWTLALSNDLAGPAAVYAGRTVVAPADASGPALTGLPAPFEALTLGPGRLYQGSTLEVTARLAEGVTLEGAFLQWPLHFAPAPASDGGTRLVSLQGIYAFLDPGLYLLSLKATQPDGAVSTFEQLVPVAPAGYPSQTLVVGADMAALLDPNVTEPERQKVSSIVAPYAPARQWNGLFLKPVSSERVTTGYGWRRSYNGGPYDSFHDGIDWGAPGGSNIIAPADGTVVFTGALQVRGNVTIIDHGWGVYTSYWHQLKVLVQIGQQVQAGEVIGQVGSTGLSTGNHLHFAVWVGGNAVDPNQWLATVFP
jgi:murein DD-endopeptidase MepM/ murein hydrolase activator NlpD